MSSFSRILATCASAVRSGGAPNGHATPHHPVEPSGAAIFTLVPAIDRRDAAVGGSAAPHPPPVVIFNVISAVVFVVILVPDFTYIPTVPGSSNGQTAILVLMHVIAASVIVRLLTSTPARLAR